MRRPVVVDMVADEYYERYRQLSHDELYRRLGAGSPAQIAALVANWSTVQTTLGSLAAALRQDLALLAPSWTGLGSREFQYRMGLIAGFAEQLAGESVAMRTGLTLMSDALAQAQQAAEPVPPDPPEWTFDGVLGPALGHAVADAERASAYERTVALVAQLAAGYALADHVNWPPAILPAPPDLPGHNVLPAGLSTVVTSTVVTPVTEVAARLPVLTGDGGTGLAGVSPLAAVAHGNAAPHLLSAAVAATAPVPTTLTGAGPGLAGVGPHLIDSRRDAPVSAGSGQAAAPVLGQAVGGGPPGGGGTPGSSHYSGNPHGGHADRTIGGQVDESAAWSVGENIVWGDNESPPAIIGDLGTSA